MEFLNFTPNDVSRYYISYGDIINKEDLTAETASQR